LITSIIRGAIDFKPDDRRGRGRLKKSRKEVIKYDLTFIGLLEDMAQDRSLWRTGDLGLRLKNIASAHLVFHLVLFEL